MLPCTRFPSAPRSCFLLPVLVATAATILPAAEPASPARSDAGTDARRVAREVNALLLEEWKTAGVTPATLASDEDFLRRVSFDLAGSPPAPQDVLAFRRGRNLEKRSDLMDDLLNSQAFATNQARYWRDVIFSRATNMRAPLARQAFEDWMAAQIRDGRGWDEIATAIVTATGDVRENGETALLFAQDGEPEDVAGEVARIFLGIQIQCANCHDHPWDSWKREQFHELAAFFPRVGVRPVREEQRILSYEIVSVDNSRFGPGGGGGPFAQNPERTFQFLDRNRDGKLTRAELANRPGARFLDMLLERADTNKDGGVSLEELKNIRPPDDLPGRGSSEHFMADLNDPASRGTRIDPLFFVTQDDVDTGLTDLERREALARSLTSPENPWFAKALVNRIWTELLGAGFYTPVDDIGPERTAEHPQVLELLAQGLVANDYDLKWLFRTIASTQAYQRQLRTGPGASDAAAPEFAAAEPTRIRADPLYTALVEIAGAPEPVPNQLRGGPGQGPYGRLRSPRAMFNALFGYDPSTPQDEVLGTVPQALFLMNSPHIDRLTRAAGRTRLAEILRSARNDREAIRDVYLLVLSREPTASELAICTEYIREAGGRETAFEDLMWSLLNSSEFVTKR